MSNIFFMKHWIHLSLHKILNMSPKGMIWSAFRSMLSKTISFATCRFLFSFHMFLFLEYPPATMTKTGYRSIFMSMIKSHRSVTIYREWLCTSSHEWYYFYSSAIYLYSRNPKPWKLNISYIPILNFKCNFLRTDIFWHI